VEIGRKPSGAVPFFDDVDRGYVVAQLEGRMDAPVDLIVAVRRTSPLLLHPPPGPTRRSGPSSSAVSWPPSSLASG
jgi:hypothetical protein